MVTIRQPFTKQVMDRLKQTIQSSDSDKRIGVKGVQGTATNAALFQQNGDEVKLFFDSPDNKTYQFTLNAQGQIAHVYQFVQSPSGTLSAPTRVEEVTDGLVKYAQQAVGTALNNSPGGLWDW